MADGDNNILRFSDLRTYDTKLKEYVDNKIPIVNEIEANPNDTGSINLTKLKIDDVVYNIPLNNVTVDSMLSATSTNAIENRAMMDALYNTIISSYGIPVVEIVGQAATLNHSIGDNILIGETTYNSVAGAKVIDDISIGDTITIDTNVEVLLPINERLDMIKANPSDTASANLTKLQIGSNIYNIPSGGTVDSDLSTTSTNAVQNKAILKAFASLILGDQYSNATLETIGEQAINNHSQYSGLYVIDEDGDIRTAIAMTSISQGDTLATQDDSDNPNVYISEPIINSIRGLSLTSLNNVQLTNPITNGQVLKYSSSYNKWMNMDDETGATIVVNPSGTASTTMNKISINGNIYSLPGANSQVSEYYRNIGVGTGSPEDPAGELLPSDGTIYFKKDSSNNITNMYASVNGNFTEVKPYIVSTTDIGEGAALPEGTLYFVVDS